jgi:hypothetical protein
MDAVQLRIQAVARRGYRDGIAGEALSRAGRARRVTTDSAFGVDLRKLQLYPGDAIVVPEKDVHPSLTNQLMIWSQFISQFSLGALEANSIK